MLALDENGALYFRVQSATFYVRVVEPSGIINRYAGGAQFAPPGDGGPALAAGILGRTAIAAGPDGSIYLSRRERGPSHCAAAARVSG